MSLCIMYVCYTCSVNCMQYIYVMLCYVMLCYVMLCYVMLCYVMFYGIITSHYNVINIQEISILSFSNINALFP